MTIFIYMQLSEEIKRIKQIIGIKLINEQTDNCPTLDQILNGEIENHDKSKYQYYKSGVINDIARSGWGPGTNEDDAIKLLKDNIKNLDELKSFSNAWKDWIFENTQTNVLLIWQNVLLNWIFNYPTFGAYLREEDEGNDIRSAMEPTWQKWLNDECTISYSDYELEDITNYIEYFKISVKKVKKYSKEQLVKTYDLKTIESEFGKDHGKFVWEADFKIKPTKRFSMQSIKIIDNYTKKELFNCTEPTCNLPVELGKEFSNSFTYIQLGDFVKPWINCIIEFNNGQTKESAYTEITYNPVVTTKKSNGQLKQEGRLITITQGSNKIKSIEVYGADKKLKLNTTDVEFFLPNQKGLYFIVINYSDTKKKQSLVKVLYSGEKTDYLIKDIN